jgi:hypothetical protein
LDVTFARRLWQLLRPVSRFVSKLVFFFENAALDQFPDFENAASSGVDFFPLAFPIFPNEQIVINEIVNSRNCETPFSQLRAGGRSNVHSATKAKIVYSASIRFVRTVGRMATNRGQT